MNEEKVCAIVLAAGQGKRMQSSMPKQYMELLGKPVLYYSLKVFEESAVDEIVLVVGAGEEDYCRREIVNKYGLKKVAYIISGGDERYLSVICGLSVLRGCSYVLIHDGARPLITVDLVDRTIEEVKRYLACVVGVPSKDTVKLINKDRVVTSTPNRKYVYNIQTPQAFSFELINKAYKEIVKRSDITVTDDAMVVETCMDMDVHIIEGSYHNIKITTPEDISIAEVLLGKNCI